LEKAFFFSYPNINPFWVKKLKNTKIRNATIAVAIMALLMISSTLVLLGHSVQFYPALTAPPISTLADYGDIMQYDWPRAGYDEGLSSGNPGPGPEKADVLYSISTSGNSHVVLFDGKAFLTSGDRVYAYDAISGNELWISDPDGSISASSNNNLFKLDDTYFLTQGSTGISVRRISNGDQIWQFDFPAGQHGMPGSGSYFGGHYSDSMQMWLMMYSDPSYDDPRKQHAGVIAIDLSDPAVPQTEPLWDWWADTTAELLCSGDGLAFLGSTEGDIIALNTNGTVEWQAPLLGGVAQQTAMYYDGKLLISAVNWYMTCLDGATGEMLWQTPKGNRAFTAYHGCVGAGMVFDETDELDPHGSVAAWDLETGELRWKNAGYFNIRYDTMCYADGKVYGVKCDRGGGQTGTLVMPSDSSFSCWDAFTGEELWNLPGIVFTYPSIAYGNLYGVSGRRLYCIGGDPTDWNFGLIGNVDQPRVAVGTQGPTDISTPKWGFQTGGDTYSSPAVVDGKVVFGSNDHNIYCLDAYTGEKIWSFETGFYVRASQAVLDGKVYTGADDGYFYCLDADTGDELWKTSAGGLFTNFLNPGEAKPGSSPIIVNNMLYCGSKDGNLYCLNLDGTVKWKFPTDNAIIGSPGYADGIVYIASTDGYFYAVNANTGTQAWKSAFTLNLYVDPPIYSSLYNVASPSVAEGVVYIAGGVQYGNRLPGTSYNFYLDQGLSVPAGSSGGGILMFAFNATTGESIWNQSRAGNSQPIYYPCYVDGYIYAPEFFSVTKMDAEDPMAGDVETPDYTQSRRMNGNRSWASWLGYQIQGSMAYADDITGDKIYAGSDIGSMYALNAEDGTSLSVFTVGANVPASPAIWEGKMYCGSTDGKMYCFDDSPSVDFSLSAAADKSAAMWNNETITIAGRLTGDPTMSVWKYSDPESGSAAGSYVREPSGYHPGLPCAVVKVSFTKPDGTDMTLETETDNQGYFSLSYSPTDTGEWGWVAYYDGMRRLGITYNQAYGEWNPFTVNSPSAGGGGGGGEEPVEGFPMEYVYAAIAVIIIVVVVFLAYFFLKRK
jgi:outer membrane protein assembly factor BamB